jgi:SOS response regulatory protein OraA/RecX
MNLTPIEKCMHDAYSLLARQGRTVAGMREKLLQKNHEASDVAAAIERLLEQGLLNDVAYAAQYIESHRNQHGDYRMRQALQRKGISEADYQQALSELEDADAFELEAVVDSLIRKKCEQMALNREQFETDYAYRQKSTAKIMRFLAGRGFALDAIHRGLRRVLSADGIDEN